MKNSMVNLIFQIFLMVGFPLIGMLLTILTDIDLLMFIFLELGWFLMSIFCFLGKVYNKGQWFSYKACVFFAILCLLCVIFNFFYFIHKYPEMFNFIPKDIKEKILTNEILNKFFE